MVNVEEKDKNTIDIKKLFNKSAIIDMVEVLFGTLLVAIAINVFFLPHKLSSGGASGIGIILNCVFNIPVGLTVIVLNIPLFVIALKKLGLSFSIKSIIGTGFLSLFLELTSFLSNIEVLNNEIDMVIASIFGGIVLGLGLSLVFRGNGSTGGSDLLAQIIYKYRPAQSMGQLMLMIDAVVIVSTILIFRSISSGLYSVILIFISKKVIDIVFEGINYTKLVNIITKNSNSIIERIMSEIGRGVTSIKCVGEYTKEEYVKIECVVTIPQISRLKRIVREEDTTAFIYIISANEVLGYGFEKVR